MLIPPDLTAADHLMRMGLNAIETMWKQNLDDANSIIEEIGMLLESGDHKEALNTYREWKENRQ